MSNETTPAKPEQKGPPPPAPETAAKRETPIAPKELQYVGPTYKYGITLPGQSERIDPKNMSAKERDELIASYPPAAEWWA